MRANPATKCYDRAGRNPSWRPVSKRRGAARLIDVREWAALEIEGRPRHDLVEGRLAEKPDVAFWHDLLLMHLTHRLVTYVQEHRRGYLVTSNARLRISEYGGREPDMFLIPEEMFPLVGKNLFKGVPPLVVEVVSPSNERTDLVEKRREYAGLGVGQYWIVSLRERRVEILGLRDGAYELAESASGDEVFRPSLFPGLEIPLGDIWPVDFEHRTDD